MNIILIHNKYGAHSGEESVVYAQRDLLRSHGHEVEEYYRSSEEIRGVGGEVNAFFSGFYNRTSANEIRRRTKDEGRGTKGRPDIVHIHNLYPLISPAILQIIRKSQFTAHSSQLTVHSSPLPTSPPKIVMTVHNYRLVCPNGLYFIHGEICEQCNGGREWNCILRNCENSLYKSTGYAARNWWARVKRSYLDNVDAFLCLTSFQKEKLAQNGFPPEKLHVLPNFMDAPDPGISSIETGTYAIFVGRLNRQKGIDLLLSAASANPDIPFKAAGEPDPVFLSQQSLPANVELTGHLPPADLHRVVGQSRFLVFTSRSYEGFPMVFLEAMKHRLPVIAPNMAGFPEIIEGGVNGLLFNPGDANDLAAKIRILWEDKELCSRLGHNGFMKLQENYSPEVYYRKLMDVYNSLLI